MRLGVVGSGEEQLEVEFLAFFLLLLEGLDGLPWDLIVRVSSSWEASSRVAGPETDIVARLVVKLSTSGVALGVGVIVAEGRGRTTKSSSEAASSKLSVDKSESEDSDKLQIISSSSSRSLLMRKESFVFERERKPVLSTSKDEAMEVAVNVGEVMIDMMLLQRGQQPAENMKNVVVVHDQGAKVGVRCLDWQFIGKRKGEGR